MCKLISISSVFATLALVAACSGGDRFTSPAPEPPPTSGTGAELLGTGGANAGGAGSSVAGAPVTTGGTTVTTVLEVTGGATSQGSSLPLGTGGHAVESTGGTSSAPFATGGNSPTTGGQAGTGGSSAFSCVGCFEVAPTGWDCQAVPAICGASAVYCLKHVCS